MRRPCTLRLPAVPFLCALSALSAGCASDGEAVEKRLAKLQEEVTRIQSETDRMSERLDAVELRQATAPSSADRVASAPQATMSRPKLKVVRVEPGPSEPNVEAPAAQPADESGPRVIIQGEGKALESRTLPAPAKPKAPAKSSEK